MALTRPFPIDQAYPNAADIRKQAAAIYPREGIFPDPVTLAAAGIAYANGGWAVGARPFVANLKRGGAPFTQAYGSAQTSNDAVSAAWTIAAAPLSGTRVDRLWIKALDPTQGEALNTETPPRAVPQYGITAGTPGIQPLPAGCLEIAQVSTPSTATSIAQSTITQTYPFAYVLGGTVFFRTRSELNAVTTLGILTRAVVLADNSEWVFNGTTWESATGGLVLVAAGEVTNGALLDLPGAFSSRFQNYRLVYEVTAGTAGSIVLGARMLAGTAVLDAATYAYGSFFNGYGGAAGTFVNSDPAALAWIGQIGNFAGGGIATGAFDIFNPYETKRTTFQGLAHCTYGTGEVDTFAGAQVRNTLSYDGLRLLPASGTFSAIARLYGYGGA
jgi:hypothetical protein